MLISRGCPWASMNRGGCRFGGSKTGAAWPKRGGCSFSVGTQAQRVSYVFLVFCLCQMQCFNIVYVFLYWLLSVLTVF